MQRSQFQDKILQVSSDSEFANLALELFRYQAERNPVYRAYINALKIVPQHIQDYSKIPFLPIEFFKTHEVKTIEFEPEVVFTSSGTTGKNTSRHYVRQKDWYIRVFSAIFRKFYGHPTEYSILALLPSYLEREGSSLVMMAQHLILESAKESSGFYLRNHQQLVEQLLLNESQQQPTLLLGVTFGLLQFASEHSIDLKHTIVMETGGMKGMREELTRDEVAAILKSAFQLSSVHSEYGMTELMSQAYSRGDGLFQAPPWMRLLVRDTNDPLTTRPVGRGVLNVIDLANIDSCAFIATQDVGIVNDSKQFMVMGRMDQSDVRGCNLLISH